MQVPPPFNPAPPQQATYNPTIPLAPAELQTLQAQQAPVTSQAKPAGRIFLAALLLGWAFDTLFVGSSIGISAPIFAGLFVATLFAVGRLEDVRPVREILWLHAALLFFSLML